ncbi:MAG: c-type cytochrome [Crocinitomicaceae bacterium]
MKKKIFFVTVALAFTTILVSCGGGSKSDDSAAKSDDTQAMTQDPESYDSKRGEGKFDASNVTLGAIDPAMVTKGEAIATTKCFSCHKITNEKLVGPGWLGVTSKHQPFWIMNFITNPDPMIDKDPEVQAQLEICLVRMPNQSLSDQDAREIVEFMRQNDGAK